MFSSCSCACAHLAAFGGVLRRWRAARLARHAASDVSLQSKPVCTKSGQPCCRHFFCRLHKARRCRGGGVWKCHVGVDQAVAHMVRGCRLLMNAQADHGHVHNRPCHGLFNLVDTAMVCFFVTYLNAPRGKLRNRRPIRHVILIILTIRILLPVARCNFASRIHRAWRKVG